MKAFARFLCVLSLTAYCVACGGGGGGAVSSPPPVINASPGGIWEGIDSDGDNVLALVTETGRFHFLEDFGNQGFGILSVSNGNDVSGNFQLVPEPGFTFADGSTLADCTLSGTVTERQTLTVTVNCTMTAGLQDQSTATLNYNALYERNSSLATIAGMYDDGFVVTDISSDGTIFEQDAVSGCVTNGQVSVIDPDFNAYDFQFGFSNCTGQFAIINGASFIGIGALDNTVTPEALIIAATGDVAGTLVSVIIITERLSSGWIPDVFLDASTFAAMCAAPRSGINPATGQPFPDILGTSTDENNFLRSYSDDTYLWYDEIVDRDPALFGTPAYFDLLKTDAITPSGQPKDKFHFTIPSDEWFELSQSGVSAGYGAQFVLLSATPPREIVVAYAEPNSPATAVNLARGAEVLVADGVDVINSNTQAEVDVLNAAFFPSQPGETHTFTVRDLDGTQRDISMTSENVTSTPVQNVATIPTATGAVGYMLFNRHIATAESGLITAVNDLLAMGISDLVVDLRYNGGGFLDIASEFAYMIAGDIPTAGQIFENLIFNDKHPTTDPVTGAALLPLLFHTTTQGFDVAAGQALPALNLSRVFVLTGPNTCSASESIMNSLEGVDVEVIQIGSTTCGKPYGFYATDNCGTTYFTIQFKGENNKGFGDYTDGFSAMNQTAPLGTVMPGCSVADDFTHALGDPTEGRLAAALMFRDSQTCPAATGIAPPGAFKTSAGSDLSAVDGYAPKSEWQQNRILRR